MGYGIYRRSPDYRQPRRAVLAAVAAVTAAPALFIRPRPPQPQPAHYHYYYQQARRKLPTLPPPPPAPALTGKRPLALSQQLQSAYYQHYYQQARRRLPTFPPPPPAPALTTLKKRLPLSLPQQFRRAWDYRAPTRYRLPTVAPHVLLQHPLARTRAAVLQAAQMRWDYRNRYRLPQVVAAITAPAPVLRGKLSLFARTRALFECPRQEFYYLPQKYPTVTPASIVPSGHTLRAKLVIHTRVFERLRDYASLLRKKLIPRYALPPTAPALVKLTFIAGRAPTLDVTGASPKIDLVAGRNPEIDDITGKC